MSEEKITKNVSYKKFKMFQNLKEFQKKIKRFSNDELKKGSDIHNIFK